MWDKWGQVKCTKWNQAGSSGLGQTGLDCVKPSLVKSRQVWSNELGQVRTHQVDRVKSSQVQSRQVDQVQSCPSEWGYVNWVRRRWFKSVKPSQVAPVMSSEVRWIIGVELRQVSRTSPGQIKWAMSGVLMPGNISSLRNRRSSQVSWWESR